MQGSNTGADAAAVRAALAGFWTGSLGFTVRCTPLRRTVWGAAADGTILFAKLRSRRLGDARAEWHWLHELPRAGLRVATAVAFERRGRRTLVCTAGVADRPLDGLVVDAIRRGQRAAAVAYACRAVATAVRRLHDQGLVFRDLYWNHLFARDLSPDGEPLFLDVERVFRPRWRFERWRIKDLAGLMASAPAGLRAADGVRFLRSYLGSSWPERAARHRLMRRIAAKAARIRAHRPRYG